MKTSLLVLSTIMLLSGCAREQVADQISSGQLNAVREMQISYQQAKAYNDSLNIGRTANLSAVMMSYYDSRYHHYETAFTTCHNGYEHNTTSANHSHSNTGMVQMHGTGGGMMDGGNMMGDNGCQCCSNGGHGADIHEQMQALHRAHAQHHPR